MRMSSGKGPHDKTIEAWGNTFSSTVNHLELLIQDLY